MRRGAREQVGKRLAESGPDLAQSTLATDRGSQYRRLHDGKEQHCHQLQGWNTKRHVTTCLVRERDSRKLKDQSDLLSGKWPHEVNF